MKVLPIGQNIVVLSLEVSPVSIITYVMVIITTKLACSKRSDSGERCEVKKVMKSRGDSTSSTTSLAFIFSRSFFISHRFPLFENLEQATTKCAVLPFFPRLSVDTWSFKARAIHLNNSNR